MPLQDLTPQLRTRLSRVERAVGWFITVAVIALIGALGYYIYHRAEAKGWFLTKINYRTSLNNAAGIKVGDPVKLMGFNVGEITHIEANDPAAYYGVTVDFRIKAPYYGYIWMDSKVRIQASDFLGNRYLEVLKGTATEGGGAPTPVTVISSNHVAQSELFFPAVDGALKALKADLKAKSLQTNSEYWDWSDHALASELTNLLEEKIAANPQQFYTNINTTNYWLEPVESPALTERMETVVNGFEAAMPNILNLTNALTRIMTNADNAVARLDSTLANAQPLISNVTAISYTLRDTNGSLGNWILPTDVHQRLVSTLTNAEETLRVAHSTLNNTDTNLTALATQLEESLINLANLTSNLNSQVQSNNNLVRNVNVAIAHTDEFVQGLKHHWLLRSAFKKKPAPNEKSK
jgi:ABC-type transporter Mla subunit MlaD